MRLDRPHPVFQRRLLTLSVAAVRFAATLSKASVSAMTHRAASRPHWMERQVIGPGNVGQVDKPGRVCYPSRNSAFNSFGGNCPTHDSPVPTVISASSRLLRIISLMRSSKVPRVMNRWTCTLRFCPMR